MGIEGRRKRLASIVPGIFSPNDEAQALTPDQQRWAEALAIERRYGDEAALHIADRIGALALAGDAAGVERMREIAERLDQLRPRARQ